MSQFEAAVQPGAVGKEDAKLRQLSDQHRRTCETLQATENALLSARQDLEHQKKLHSSTTERLQSRFDDLQVQVTKLVQALDRKRTTRVCRYTHSAGGKDSAFPRSEAPPPPKARRCLTLCSWLWRNCVLQTTRELTSTTRRGIHLCRCYTQLGWHGGLYPFKI